jgi:hypothetical protein
LRHSDYGQSLAQIKTQKQIPRSASNDDIYFLALCVTADRRETAIPMRHSAKVKTPASQGGRYQGVSVSF